MTPTQAALSTAGLFVSILLAIQTGWLWGRRSFARLGPGSAQGLPAIQTAVFGLLGLMLAFAFGAAQTRLEARRALIVVEHDAVEAAYMRVDVMAQADQPALRALFRRYLDARLRVYESLADREATQKALDDGAALQREIWRDAVRACRNLPWPAQAILILPAINLMIASTTAQTVALDAHTSLPIFILLWVLGPVSGLLGGFAMSDSTVRSPLHVVIYSLIVALTFYVILDLDSARFGFIRLGPERTLLGALRERMN